MKTILLDNGHGGIINGVYQTNGKRSPIWDDGSILYEGEFTRAIVNGIIQELTVLEIPYVNLVPELTDIPLKERIKRANSYTDSILLSIHANAGGGSGFEAFTYFGVSASDRYATIFYNKFKKEFPTVKVRVDTTDGDMDKEANFYMLKHSSMPAVLTENFFMDNEHECREYLMSEHGRHRIIKYHVDAIKEIIK